MKKINNRKMVSNSLIQLIIFLTLLSCEGIGSDDLNVGGGKGDEFLGITLKPTISYQKITGFGASDAWSTQFVGKNWPLQKRNTIADLLFSEEFDVNGNPKGIGLDIWRFNIGAGSISQGNNSNINDEWRRAESFINSNGYNWNAHEGQRWFVEAAKQRGMNQFVAFSNSPPITMTKNGLANSSGGTSANIEPSKYGDYVDFLTTVIENYRDLYGVEFNYISPFNEPQYDWRDGQEGSPWQNTEIANITRLLDAKIQSKNLNTKIQIAESGQLNYLYENANKQGRANQIQDFFNSNSSNYLGNLSSLHNSIVGHSYFTTFDTSYLIDVRTKVDEEINRVNNSLEFWMTEYSIIEDNVEINGNQRDLGIDPALYVARLIHTDLTIANASSWQWWLAVSPYDYKDGLVYIDDNKNDGEVYESKLLWGLGNYSKFIKPGYHRIGLSRSDNKTATQSINGLLVSSYSNTDNSKYVTVFVNQRNIEIPVKLEVNGQESYTGKIYQTSAITNDNLRNVGTSINGNIIKIPARSIVTVVIE